MHLPQQRRSTPMPPATDPITSRCRDVRPPAPRQIGNQTIRLDARAERIRQQVQQRDDKQVFLRSDGQVTMRTSWT